MGGHPFSSALRATVAPVFSWKMDGACELEHVALYYRLARHDDRWIEDNAVFDRDGNCRTVGAEATLTLDEANRLGFYCERTGSFRRLSRRDIPTLYLGAECRRQPTDGSEFDSRGRAVHIGGD